MADTRAAQKSDIERNIERVSQGAHKAVDRATSAASDVVDNIAGRGEDLLELKDNWLEGARDYVRDNPLAALGVALAAGYLLHMITRSR